MADIKLIGSRITKINAEINPGFSGKLEIKTNISIVDAEKTKESKDTLKIKYIFGIDYLELGSLSIQGTLFIQTDSKTTKEILKATQERKLDSNEYVAITNLINKKATIKAIEIEDELGLPIHIKFPTLSIKK